MPSDKKILGGKACEEADQSAAEGKQRTVQAKAPDQDVLPGILGKQLRAAYGELLNSPVPDAFTDLIKKLEQHEPGAAPGQAGKPSAPTKDGDQ